MKIIWIANALCAGALASSGAYAQDLVPVVPDASAQESEPQPGVAEPDLEPGTDAPQPDPEPGAGAPESAPASAPPSAAVAAPPSTPSGADESDVETAFEESKAEPTGAHPADAGLTNLELSLILDAAAAYYSEDEHLQTGVHDPEKTGFNLQQLKLSAAAAVDPYLRFDAHLVFSLFGAELEEAYATTLDLPLRLQARFGQFLTRFGRLNALHLHDWDFVDQPFAIGRVFGGEGNRGLGVELSWLAPLPWAVKIVASALNSAGEATMRSFYGGRDLGVTSLDDLTYVTALEQFFPFSDDWSLALGLSGAFGPNSTSRTNRTDVYGADLHLEYRPITRRSSTVVALTSEWFYRRRQIPDDLLQDLSGYASLSWKFSRRWGLAARYEYGSPALDVDGHVALVDPLDPEWVRARHRLAQNVTFWPSEFSRFRLQVGRDMPGYRDPIWAVFLAAEVVAGAHGAHAFGPGHD